MTATTPLIVISGYIVGLFGIVFVTIPHFTTTFLSRFQYSEFMKAIYNFATEIEAESPSKTMFDDYLTQKWMFETTFAVFVAVLLIFGTAERNGSLVLPWLIYHGFFMLIILIDLCFILFRQMFLSMEFVDQSKNRRTSPSEAESLAMPHLMFWATYGIAWAFLQIMFDWIFTLCIFLFKNQKSKTKEQSVQYSSVDALTV